MPVGHPAAEPVAEREVGEDQPDDVRPDDRRRAEVGREQPRRADLGRQRAGAGEEDDDPEAHSSSVAQRRRRRLGRTAASAASHSAATTAKPIRPLPGSEKPSPSSGLPTRITPAAIMFTNPIAGAGASGRAAAARAEDVGERQPGREADDRARDGRARAVAPRRARPSRRAGDEAAGEQRRCPPGPVRDEPAAERPRGDPDQQRQRADDPGDADESPPARSSSVTTQFPTSTLKPERGGVERGEAQQTAGRSRASQGRGRAAPASRRVARTGGQHARRGRRPRATSRTPRAAEQPLDLRHDREREPAAADAGGAEDALREGRAAGRPDVVAAGDEADRGPDAGECPHRDRERRHGGEQRDGAAGGDDRHAREPDAARAGRSARRPAGSCIPAWVTKSAVVKTPDERERDAVRDGRLVGDRADVREVPAGREPEPDPACGRPPARSARARQRRAETLPTVSPRLFTSGSGPKTSTPSRARKRPSAGRSARGLPSSTLSATPVAVGRGRADQALGAALGDPAGALPHQRGVVARRRRRRAPAARASPRDPRPRPQQHARPRERHRVGRDAAAVDRAPERRRAELADPALQRVLGEPVAARRPAVRAAGGEHARVLARAVVAELPLRPALLRPVLEVVHRRPARASSVAHRLELRRLRLVRGARDRELGVGEVVVGLVERHRLDRLPRRAQEGDEVGVAGGRDDPSVAHGDRVDAVDRLDDVAARDGYADRVHGGDVRCLSFPRSRRCAAPSTSR